MSWSVFRVYTSKLAIEYIIFANVKWIFRQVSANVCLAILTIQSISHRLDDVVGIPNECHNCDGSSNFQDHQCM
jgi:hypothetical protein